MASIGKSPSAWSSACIGVTAALVVLAVIYPAPPELWSRLDFNGAPFEDFIGPYFETARSLPAASSPAPGYHYPAFLALLLAPLARLGPAVASYAWLAVELAAMVALVALPLAWSRAKHGAEVAVFVLLAALSHPLAHNLYWGQVSAPLAALLLVGVGLGARGRCGAEATCIGVAAAVKLVPALFLLGPLVRGDRRSVLVGGAVAVGLVVLPSLAILGPGDTLRFHTVVVERLGELASEAATVEGGRGSQDLGAALARWTGDPRGYLVGRFAGLALAVALTLRLRRERDPGVVFAHLALLAPLVVAPTWSHGLAFVPAAAWFLWSAPWSGAAARAAALAALALTSLLAHAPFSGPEAHARAGLGAAAVVCLALGALLRRASDRTRPA